ncbi:hypothetical protein ACOME3_009948 [Neoechinorhynchus agilis]
MSTVEFDKRMCPPPTVAAEAEANQTHPCAHPPAHKHIIRAPPALLKKRQLGGGGGGGLCTQSPRTQSPNPFGTVTFYYRRFMDKLTDHHQQQQQQPSPLPTIATAAAAADDSRTASPSEASEFKTTGSNLGHPGDEPTIVECNANQQTEPTINTGNHDEYSLTTPDYLAQLISDKRQIKVLPSNLFIHVNRLLDREISHVRERLLKMNSQNSTDFKLPNPEGQIIAVSQKLYIPVDEHPDFNFIGRILGPRGMTAKQLEIETGCKIMVRGKGSIRDRAKEEQMKEKPNWQHLSDNLHVLITCEDYENRVNIKLKAAVDKVSRLLEPKPEGEDELKRRQLIELAKLNGTYRDNSICSQLVSNVTRVQFLPTNLLTATAGPVPGMPSVAFPQVVNSMANVAATPQDLCMRAISQVQHSQPIVAGDQRNASAAALFDSGFMHGLFNPTLFYIPSQPDIANVGLTAPNQMGNCGAVAFPSNTLPRVDSLLHVATKMNGSGVGRSEGKLPACFSLKSETSGF